MERMSLHRRALLGGVATASAMLAVNRSGFRALASDATPAAAYTPTIVPGNFVPTIDNPFLPLIPGTLFIYDGMKDNRKMHNEMLATSDTKTIMGVPCVVVQDRVWEEGTLIESTLDWYAQDTDGNVWYMGEYSEAYEDGKTDTAGSWEGGVDGALPGIIMDAHPAIGDPYRQEYYAGEAEDMAQVIEIGTPVTVPYGSYTDTITTREWSALEPSVEENKFYARGIGFVSSKSTKGENEMFELTDIKTGVSATPTTG